MSELDLIFNRKRKEEKKESSEEQTEKIVKETEQNTFQEIQTEKRVEENKNDINTTNEIQNNKIEEIMKKFIEKDPKIGIWSYPSYLVLQYLYNTVPGFKMSRTAKEALERGLREMYPDLFQIAEKVAKEHGKI